MAYCHSLMGNQKRHICSLTVEAKHSKARGVKVTGNLLGFVISRGAQRPGYKRKKQFYKKVTAMVYETLAYDLLYEKNFPILCKPACCCIG